MASGQHIAEFGLSKSIAQNSTNNQFIFEFNARDERSLAIEINQFGSYNINYNSSSTPDMNIDNIIITGTSSYTEPKERTHPNPILIEFNTITNEVISIGEVLPSGDIIKRGIPRENFGAIKFNPPKENLILIYIFEFFT